MSNWQVPDNFKYKGRDYKFQPYFLRPYFTKYPNRRIDTSKARYRITNHHRLYTAYFGVNENDLEIFEFKFRINKTENESKLVNSFPEIRDRKLSWFNGIILLGQGNESLYYTAYYNTLLLREHEKYVILEFKEGKLMKELSFDQEEFRKFKNSQYELFKLTELYIEERKKVINLITRRHERIGEVWEFNEEKIKNILLGKLIFLIKSIIEN